MGAKGNILADYRSMQCVAIPPEVKVENTIGAGDSAVAGFVYGLVNGKDLKESLVLAAAAGTATTLRLGTALSQKEDFLNLVSQVKLNVLQGGA